LHFLISRPLGWLVYSRSSAMLCDTYYIWKENDSLASCSKQRLHSSTSLFDALFRAWTSYISNTASSRLEDFPLCPSFWECQHRNCLAALRLTANFELRCGDRQLILPGFLYPIENWSGSLVYRGQPAVKSCVHLGRRNPHLAPRVKRFNCGTILYTSIVHGLHCSFLLHRYLVLQSRGKIVTSLISPRCVLT